MTMDPEARRALRRARLDAMNLTPAVVDEVLAYTENVFRHEQLEQLPSFPLQDETHVPVWVEYSRLVEDSGFLPALSNRLLQLRFPVREGMSQHPTYRAATRKGVLPSPFDDTATGLELKDPGGVRVVIHSTIAGRIPLIIAEAREDFEALVRAFTDRSEPQPVPVSMGACIVRGFNNWDRIQSYRRSWQILHPDAPAEAWSQEFQKLVPHKDLYQDSFILLSSAEYSGVSSDAARLPSLHWKPLSVRLRLEHEATHYFTWRVLGSMRNNLLDELIADYVALVRVFGRYDARLARLFLGLEEFPAYRHGGRLENYRGTPPLGPEAFAAVQRLVNECIDSIAIFQRDHEGQATDDLLLVDTVLALTSMTLEEIAAGNISEVYASVRAIRQASQSRVTATHDEMLLTIENNAAAVDEVIARFRDFGERHTLSASLVSSLNLALDEIVSNIIKYGYEDQLSHQIEVRFHVADGVLTTEIIDDARAFNILEMEDPDVSLSLEERGIGGLGIYLVKNLTDEQAYERTGGRNHLTLRKRLE